MENIKMNEAMELNEMELENVTGAGIWDTIVDFGKSCKDVVGSVMDEIDIKGKVELAVDMLDQAAEKTLWWW